MEGDDPPLTQIPGSAPAAPRLYTPSPSIPANVPGQMHDCLANLTECVNFLLDFWAKSNVVQIRVHNNLPTGHNLILTLILTLNLLLNKTQKLTFN